VLLASCGSYTKIKPDGTVKHSAGFLDESEGQITEVTSRFGDKITSIYSRPNRTRVAGKLIDGVATYGAAALISKGNIADSDNAAAVEGKRIDGKTTVEMKGLENQALEITGKNEVNKLNAK
jgi:hypothetical protein